MAEPPSKRQKRGDSHERDRKQKANGTSKPTKGDKSGELNGEKARPAKEEAPKYSVRDERRHNSRSRSRDRGDRRREQSRDRAQGDRDQDRRGRDRGGKDDRPRHKSQREQPRSDRRRSRSKSPVREDKPKKDSVRQRSPPRESRAGRSRERPPRDSNHSEKCPPPTERPPPSERPPPTEPVSQARSAPPVKPKPKSKPNDKVTNGSSGKMEIDTGKTSDEELQEQMQKMMGFATFKSTKNTKVPGNDKLYAVRKEKKTEYRQYMNRVGGFNRPLSPSR